MRSLTNDRSDEQEMEATLALFTKLGSLFSEMRTCNTVRLMRLQARGRRPRARRYSAAPPSLPPSERLPFQTRLPTRARSPQDFSPGGAAAAEIRSAGSVRQEDAGLELWLHDFIPRQDAQTKMLQADLMSRPTLDALALIDAIHVECAPAPSLAPRSSSRAPREAAR